MPSLIADVEGTPAAVAIALVGMGMLWRNPHTNEISLFTDEGDRLVVHSSDQALREFGDGACLQLWLNDSDDLTITNIGGKARLHFDRFSAHLVATILSSIEMLGFRYLVSTQ